MKFYTSYYNSPLGLLQIQCSEEHITSVSFCETSTSVADDDHPLTNSCIEQLQEYFSGKRKEFSLPLQQSGTPFQMKVWNLLSTIAYGKTISYNDFSKMYGDTKAIRAVASANGKNQIAIIVPCHRVIGSNHSLVGYAGGLWRKKYLLELEAKYFHGVQQLDFAASSSLM